MKNCSLLIALFAVLTAMARTAHASGLEKLWELRISEIGGESPSQSGADSCVFDVRFSPDGRRIAAVVGPSSSDEFLLVFDLVDPRKSKKRFDVNPELWADPLKNGFGLLWSPSGQEIILDGTQVRLSDETQRHLLVHPPHFFIHPDQLITEDGMPGLPGGLVLDVSVERGLVAVCPSHGRDTCYVSVVDISRGATVRELEQGKSGFSCQDASVRFADSGRVICGTRSGLFYSTVKCWEIDTGKEIASVKGGGGWTKIETARRARRIVISDYTTLGDWIGHWSPFGEGPAARPKRMIWDLGSGKKIASWKSKSQHVLIDGRPKPATQAYRFAISPDGEHLVEGGAGVLSLNRIKP